MKISPFSEISVMSKAAILFVFVSLILFIALVTTTFFPVANELYMWELRLFVIFGYVSWWLNSICVIRTTNKKGFYRYSILLSVVTVILTVVEVTSFIIMRCRIFNIVGMMKVWKWQHPVMAYISDLLLCVILLAWIIQYAVNIVIIFKKIFVPK